MPDTSKPAFPTPTPFLGEGMSLRDYLAGQALTGILANPTWTTNGLASVGISTSGAAVRLAGLLAYEYADSTLAAREG